MPPQRAYKVHHGCHDTVYLCRLRVRLPHHQLPVICGSTISPSIMRAIGICRQQSCVERLAQHTVCVIYRPEMWEPSVAVKQNKHGWLGAASYGHARLTASNTEQRKHATAHAPAHAPAQFAMVVTTPVYLRKMYQTKLGDRVTIRSGIT